MRPMLALNVKPLQSFDLEEAVGAIRRRLEAQKVVRSSSCRVATPVTYSKGKIHSNISHSLYDQMRQRSKLQRPISCRR